MRYLKAFALGSIAFGVLVYAGVAAMAVAAQASGRTLALGLGPLVVVSVERDLSEFVTTFGPGLLALALLGGCLNLVAAAVVQRRAGGGGDGVD